MSFRPVVLAFLGCVASPSVAQTPRELSRVYHQQFGSALPDERDWHTFREYDFDRREPGRRGYFANRYYRDGRYYEVRSLAREDRVYRGGDSRYYCRRADGTTGLIVHGLTGRISKPLDRGESRLLGALDEARLGGSIDRGEVTCR